MLKTQRPTDYLKKESEIAEQMGEEQHMEQTAWQQRPSLTRFKRSDDDLKLPDNFVMGQAIGGGDCFFDAVAKGLKQLKPEMDFTIKSLREVCKRFAQSQLGNDQSWLKDALANEAESIDAYIPRIEFTANEVGQRLEQVNVLRLDSPIWGRSEVEGRIICKEYNIKLHVVEKHTVEGREMWTNQIVDELRSRSIDDINYNEANTIHIINKGSLHFEPILRTQEIRHSRSHSDFPDYDDDQTRLSEDLIRTIRGSDSEEEKVRKIRDLIDQGADVNFKDANHQYNTPLHAAVRKGNLEVVKLLIDKGADIDAVNTQNQKPLDIAELLNKQNIIQILKQPASQSQQKVSGTGENKKPEIGKSEISSSSRQSGQQSRSSAQAGRVNLKQQSAIDYNRVNDRLEEFVNYFVKEFEAKLYAYHMILEGKVKKAGKFSDTFSGKAGKGIGGTIGGGLGLLLTPFVGPAALRAGITGGAALGEEGAKALGDKLGESYHRNKIINLSNLIYYSQKNKADVRKILVEAGFDVFQSFEMQFMRVTTDQGHEGAMRKLAEDASNRAIKYLQKKKEGLITEGVILGESKVEPVLGVPAPNSKIKTPGFEINYEYKSSSEKWYTASLYEKVGLVIEEKTPRGTFSYHEKKDGKSRAEKYGYRRLFISESWDKLKEKYKLVSVVGSKSGQFTDYRYVLSSNDLNQQSNDILEKINLDDKDLGEERIKKILEEVRGDIIEVVNVLKGQSRRYAREHEEDRKILANIENNLKNLKVDEYLGRFEQHFEEAKQEIKKTQKEIDNLQKGQDQVQQVLGRVEDKLNEMYSVVVTQGSRQVKEAVWFDVRDSVTFFTALSPGREDQLNKIADNIQQKMVVITGESGVGKSELAIKYARSKYGQDSAIWINAKTPEAIKRSFCELAKYKLKIKFEENEEAIKFLVQGVYEHFTNQKSLFIFDNAEKYSAIEEFLPLYLPPNANKPWILITSTNPQKSEWESPKVEILELNSFDRSEAIEFVKKALGIQGNSQNEDIIKLAEKLYDFPLLLEYAVVEIKSYQKRNSEFKISNYVESLNFESTLRTDMLAKILKVRVDKIRQRAHGLEALEILNIMAYFASGRVQEEIFLELVSNDRIRLDNTIHLLIEHSVVKQGSMHELVQQVIRSKLQNQQDGSEEKTLEQALNLLKKCMKSLDSVEHYVPHIISIWNHASKYDKLIEDFIVNAVDSESSYTTYLHLIAESSSNEIVSAIFNKISDDKLEQIIKVKRQDQKTLLHCAALGGNEQTVRLLIDKGAMVDVVDKLKNTPLHLAAKNGNVEVVNFLLDRENNVNAKTKYKFTPLHLAAKNGYLKVVEALLEKRADVIAATNRGFTALHFAVDNKQEEVVDVLLSLDEVKENIDGKTRHEYTSLHLAAKSGHLGIVNKLLAKEASVDAKTRLKFTPLHLAAKHGHKDVILTLIEKGADVNAKDQDGFTPLHLAAQGGHIESVNALLGKSALINAETKHKFTPLHLAARNGRKDIVEILLNREADINAQTTKGNTALHLAAENGNLEVVKALLAKNVDIIDVENEEGKKAFDLAGKMDNLAVKEYIRQQTFNRRSGTSGISGQLYEIQLLMLFLMKGPEKTNGFHLATNVKEAGDFDDVVFKYKDQEKSKVVFLQAKHRENPEKDGEKITLAKLFSESEKGDFNLKKYFNSYRKIKQQFSEEKVDPIFGSKFEDSDFVIYTNALPNFGENYKSIEKIAVGQEEVLNLEESGHYYKLRLDGEVDKERIDILRYTSDCKKLARELAKSIFSGKELDINEGILRDYHIPLAEKVIQRQGGSEEGELRDSFLSDEDNPFRSAFFEEVRKRSEFTEKLEDELKSELKSTSIKLPGNFGRMNAKKGKYPESLPGDLVSDNEIEEFLNKLRLFIGQPNESELSEIVKHRIQAEYRVAEQDIDSVFSDIEYRVRRWWQSGNNYLTEDNRFFQDAARISIEFDVKEPVELFTGRARELEILHQAVQDNVNKCTVISQMTSVSGLGGIGKSELTRRYIQEHSQDYDGNVIWINAENYETLVQSFTRLAKDKLKIVIEDDNGKPKEIKSIVEDVYRFFLKKKSLFIFDNAEKYRTTGKERGVDDFLPHLPSDANKPYIVITSRNQKWGNIKVIPLGIFSEPEAIEFIKKALKIKDNVQEQDIVKLAKILQRFPLALQQAVAYIKERDVALKNIGSKFDINDYLVRYEEETRKLLNFQFPEDSSDLYTKTTFTTWKITTDKIKEDPEHGTQAGEILEIIAYFAPNSIPVEIFLKLELINDNGEKLGDAIQLLKQYSMVNDGKEQNVVDIHRLVQEVTRINLKEQNKEEEIIGKAFVLLKESFPYGSDKMEDYPRKQQLLPHFEAFLSNIDDWIKKDPAKKQTIEETYVEDLLTRMGDGYGALGDPNKQKELLERALEIEEKHYGRDHFQVAITLHNLGNAYGALGDPNKQKELLERALEIEEKHYGRDHFQVAITLGSLGNAYGDLGDHSKQKELLERALVIEEKHYGRDHFQVVKLLASLGNAYWALGDHSKQKELLEQALLIIEKHYGRDHFQVAKLLASLGNAYGDLGDHSKQKELLEQALLIIEKHYSRDHFQVAMTLDNLGNAYGALGDPDKAKELFERALAIKEKHYGRDHFQVAITLGSLGIAYGDLGDHSKQKELLERALAIKEKHYGRDHFEVAITLGSLGIAYGDLGDHSKQKELLERALPIFEKHYGRDHFEVAMTLNNLGNAYGDLGDHSKKKELLERALAIEEKHYGIDHFQVAITLASLGTAYGDLGDHSKQKELLERASAIEEKHYGSDHFEVAITLHNLGIAYGALGDHNKKKELLERALEIEEKHYGRDHFQVAITLHNLGIAYGALGDHSKKKELLERALAIKEKHYGRDHFQVAITLNNLGIAYGALGDHNKKKELLERALEIEEKHYGRDHFQVAITLHNLGIAYGALGDHSKKKELLERALAIKEKHYGRDHFQVAITLNNLGNAYGDLGDLNKQKELLERALPIMERHYGIDHFQVAGTLNNLGTTYGDLGDHSKKKELLERALAIEEKHYGRDHFQVARTLNNLGNAYGDLGDHSKQKELLEQALAIQEKHYGRNHFEVAITLNNLGIAYGALGDHSKQKELLERALAIQEKHYGSDHFQVASTLNNLGTTYGALGDHSKKKELLERALAIKEKHYGRDHFQVAKLLRNLGNAYGALGDHSKQKELLERALAIKEKHYGRDHFQVAKLLRNLGNAYGALGDHSKQKELLERALAIQEKHYGMNHFKVAKLLASLGNAYGALGDPNKQKELLERALAIKEKHYGMNHFKVAITLNNLGNAYGALGDDSKQKELLERALPILESHYGSSHQYTLIARRNIERAQYALSNPALSNLHSKARNGNINVVRNLVGEGADVLARDSHDTVLHQAVSSNNEELIRFILDKIKEKDPQNFSEHINAKDTEGDTPLMWAAENNNKVNAAKILLEYGADIDIVDNDGQTALHDAADGGYLEFIQLLLDNHADPNIKDKNGKTPLDLAQKKLDQDPENENLKIITALLLSITGEPKPQQQEEQVSGLVQPEECLPGPSSARNRKKREAQECELSWEDVDEFNEEKEDIRDFSKIKVNSDKFIDYIKSESMSEAKISQLIQLANKVPVIGESQGFVGKLINNQKVMDHLNRVGRVSGIAMHGMMAKATLAAFLNGDEKGVAINLGFIAGGQGFSRVAQAASVKGAGLVADGKIMLGRSLKAASPFLARGTSAFVVYDLVNQVKAFKNGTEDALVGVVGDSIYLGVDVAEIGIEIAEVFEVFEGVSSITGPIGAAIGAVIFVGTDIYLAVKRVDKIDEIIHLTGKERFIEGLRAFIGMKPEGNIEELMEEKQVSNQLVKQGLEYLKQHSDIQRYVFPTQKLIIDCYPVKWQEEVCDRTPRLPDGKCIMGTGMYRTYEREECKVVSYKTDLDNKVLLDSKRTDIKWSRSRPDDSGDGRLFCSPKGDYEQVPSTGAYFCENAIGITDLATNKTGNYTLINLGKGNDHVEGLLASPNIIISAGVSAGNGYKRLYGGNRDDIFIVQGNIKGYINGGNGTDTLDLGEFALGKESVLVNLNELQVNDLWVTQINRILARKNKKDVIHCDVSTKYVDGRGGKDKNAQDIIDIDYSNCLFYYKDPKDCNDYLSGNFTPEVQIVIRPYTTVNNNVSLRGNFSYIVDQKEGEASINLMGNRPLNRHNFLFNYILQDIDTISIHSNSNTRITVKFTFLSHVTSSNITRHSETSVSYIGATNLTTIDNISYTLSDGTKIKIGDKGNSYAVQNINKSIDEIIGSYPAIANRLRMYLFVQSLLSNETIAIGHGKHDVLHNNPYYKSHLVGNGGENIFVVISGYEVLDNHNLPIPEVVIYDVDAENLIDTLDLRQIKQQIMKDLGKDVKAKTTINGHDLLIELFFFNFTKGIVTVRLKNALVTNWHERLQVILNNVPMKIEEFDLKPLPIVFSEDKEIIVVTPKDIEKKSKLVISRKAGDYVFARSGDDLIITSAFDRNLTNNEFCTICLNNFYQEPKMETLSIKFTDKEILLKDEMDRINNASILTKQLAQYKNDTYNTVFDHGNTISNITDLHQRKRREVKSYEDQEFFYARSNFNTGLKEEKVTNSGSRPTSWIASVAQWVKGFIGQPTAVRNEVFYAQNNANPGTENSANGLEINAAVVHNTLLLGDVAARLITGNKHKQPKHDSLLSPKELIERRMDNTAINAINNFEKICDDKYGNDFQNATNNDEPMTCLSNVSLAKPAIKGIL